VSPDFEDLVGFDVERGERERLRDVHEMLVTAGPPAELPPHLEAGPTLAMTLNRRPRKVTRRIALLAAAICVLAIAFLVGYISGNNGSGLAGSRTLQLAGTQAAPSALAALKILPSDTSGNWPMRFTGTGLPKLAAKGYYEVWLVRGNDWDPCGSFIAKGTGAAVDVTLNAPYRLRAGDKWVVTRQLAGDHRPGQIVLQPTA
jgi:hypothetical protein